MKCSRDVCDNDAVKNGIYCSRSCAAKVNNAKYRKRKLKGMCKACSGPIPANRRYCSEECRESGKPPRLSDLSPEEIASLTKVCIDCKREKSFNEFHLSASSRDGRQGRCKPCNIAKAISWQQDNSERYSQYVQQQSGNEEVNFRRRARNYGLTPEELQKLLDDADGKCEICEQPPTRWLVVDHCHKGGNVRGILCEQCNQALGLFKDNPEVMQRAINYLKA